jgi:DNA-directed RNA polymerase subunit RPC12/RpoP
MRFNLIPPRHTFASVVRRLAEGLESGAIVLRPGAWRAEPMIFDPKTYLPFPAPGQQPPAQGPGSAAEPVPGQPYHVEREGYHADYRCPACGKETTDYTPEPGDRLRRCTSCGLAFVVRYREEDMP